MGESFTFAEKDGVPGATMATLLSEAVFGSVVYKSYGQHLTQRAAPGYWSHT
jgi:3-hydroxyisobutyrate dehydrogenase-like beta-hydroxyacid dehydrogenase